jgi:phosphatidate phosphatase APP1
VELAAGAAGEWVGFRALTKPGDERVFAGRALLVPAEGVSVISDLDDTVKVTEVFAGRMLRNTFAREFKGVPEMAQVYRRWEERHGRGGGAFHYVSGSPWQLYPFLAAFLREQGFPEGTWHLRDFRLMPRDLLKTMRSSRRVKGRHCRELMRAFPGRRFILVGDSGELDPEMYAGLARAFPEQVERIYIRDVKGEGMGSERWKKVFKGLPRGLWRIFDEARELE